MKTIMCNRCQELHQVPGRKSRRNKINVFVLSADDYVICSCGCWLWKWSVSIDGYALVIHKSKPTLVNRIQLDLLTTDLLALHHCDNRRCINLEHLYAGTPQDNMNDKYARGRASNNNNSKLTEADVLAIRAEFASGKVTRQELADHYGVSKRHIGDIVNRCAWKHV